MKAPSDETTPEKAAMNTQEGEIYTAGDVVLDSGAILADARIAYATFGKLSAAGDNAILIPTHFGGTHVNSQYLIGNDRAIDPARYFVVVVNLTGNGASSSPSHGQGANFPLVSIADNVRLQYRLLTESLGVKKLALAAGHSMGAVTAFHWAVLFPDFVERAAPICGAARISTHNHVFLEGMRGILVADPVFNSGNYTAPPLSGLRTMARAWAAWPPSAGFYRHADYASLGYTSVEDYLERYWETSYVGMDANNVIAQINTWQSADIGALPAHGGDFQSALRSIRARTFVMPCVSDAYFPIEDSEIEVAAIPNAQLRPIRSRWGHWAGSGRNADDTAFIDAQIRELLAE